MRTRERQTECGGVSFRIPNSSFRPGLTLAEVLISLFVLAIGMMGVLALYPLGARQMANAVKDERAAQLAGNAEGMMRIYWRSACLTNGSLDTTATIIGKNPELQFLDGYPGGTPLAAIPETSSGPSWPLYIDPIGYMPAADPLKSWVGSSPQVIPRRGATMGGTSSLSVGQRLRLFGLLDDMTFNQNGLTGASVDRGHRYNCGWMIQRAKNNVRQEVNLKVVVYQNRSPDSPPTEISLGDTSPVVGSDAIGLNSANGLRIGDWLLLTHRVLSNGQANPEPFADFYRIVSLDGKRATVTPQIRPHGSASYIANVVLLSDVVEVFDRGTITPFEVPAN